MFYSFSGGFGNMTKYGKAAVEAVELTVNGYCHCPKEAWEKIH